MVVVAVSLLLLLLLLVVAVVVSPSLRRTASLWAKTLPRDIRSLYCLMDITVRMQYLSHRGINVVDLFEQRARSAKYADKVAIIHELHGREFTFRDLDVLSNRVANYALAQGIKKGDVVALFMESRPEFVAMWLGLAKIGAVTAFINFNLKGASLTHSIAIAHAKAVIFSSELSDTLAEVYPGLSKAIALAAATTAGLPADKAPPAVRLPLFSFGEARGAVTEFSPFRVDQFIMSENSTVSSAPPPRPARTFHDVLLYIYTSGTTGLPKAALIKHDRFFYMAYSLALLFRITEHDRVYCTLPLYHSAGGIAGIGQALVNGATVVVRSKFSASRFWDDCIKFECTVIQYIGELCRFLLSTPPCDAEQQHRVRLAVGNGIRPDVWREFQTRFRIPQIGEFYGSTEGNANLVNTENREGAIGFNSIILPNVYPVKVIRYDMQNDCPVRDPKTGLCIVCKPGEIGELVGRIVSNRPLRQFDGYVGAAAASRERKLARDVMAKGDCFFRTGDLLLMDDEGYLYFKDRVGDTFRWKGENVSTTEVEEAVRECLGQDCSVSVYGVEVAQNPGRAGMAAISFESTQDADESANSHKSPKQPPQTQLTTSQLDMLLKGVNARLPVYARPLFLRVVAEHDMTGTFKLKKSDLQKQGFDPKETAGDVCYFMSPSAKQFVKVDQALASQLQSGEIRL
ncbi:solute carrier family 27 [Capsaspora owczarzaki ATCC 30864]|uniref:Solute carrier family 27 n=2 Tax=Capsaspora owczarzaki (strain ATCC 30864) TaxID=595528 RepID=A0A0D2X535_CAPO3|nr:solute carrier family 27 [Capsaspora owczarzaki ATCC 30864]